MDNHGWEERIFPATKKTELRIELRKTVTGVKRPAKHWAGGVANSAQVLVVIDAKGIRMSMNGTAEFQTTTEFSDFYLAVRDAQQRFTIRQNYQ